MNRASYDAFLAALGDQHKRFRDQIDATIGTLVGENPNLKKEAITTSLAFLKDLKRSLAEADYPEWLPAFESALSEYCNTSGNMTSVGQRLLLTYAKYSTDITRPLNLDNGSSSIIDFSSIYEKAYTESKLPELFQKLIEQLEQIIKSGQIDSIIALDALEKLLKIIRRNSTLNYISHGGAIAFARRMVVKSVWHAIRDTPGLGAVAKGIEDTIKEIEGEASKVRDTFADKMKEEPGFSDFKLEGIAPLLLEDNKE